MSKSQFNGWLKIIGSIIGFLIIFATIIKGWQKNSDDHAIYESAVKLLKVEGSDISRKNVNDITQINTKLDRIILDIDKIGQKIDRIP